MFKVRLFIIMLAFYLAAGVVAVPLAGGFMKYMGSPSKTNLLFIIREMIGYSTGLANTVIQGFNSSIAVKWAILFIVVAVIALLFSMAAGHGYTRILERMENIGRGDFSSRLTEKGLFASLSKTVNRLSGSLGEKERKSNTDALEEKKSAEDVLGRVFIMISEGKGKIDVLADSGLLSDASYEKTLLAEVRESLDQASGLIGKHMNAARKTV